MFNDFFYIFDPFQKQFKTSSSRVQHFPLTSFLKCVERSRKGDFVLHSLSDANFLSVSDKLLKRFGIFFVVSLDKNAQKFWKTFRNISEYGSDRFARKFSEILSESLSEFDSKHSNLFQQLSKKTIRKRFWRLSDTFRTYFGKSFRKLQWLLLHPVSNYCKQTTRILSNCLAFFFFWATSRPLTRKRRNHGLKEVFRMASASLKSSDESNGPPVVRVWFVRSWSMFAISWALWTKISCLTMIPFWGGSFWSKAMRANLSALALPWMGNLPTSVFSICEGIQCTKKSKSLTRNEAIFFRSSIKEKFLAYADDLLLMMRSKKDLDTLLRIVEQWCSENALTVNNAKRSQHRQEPSVSNSWKIHKCNRELQIHRFHSDYKWRRRCPQQA
jgi:hypothetical protein